MSSAELDVVVWKWAPSPGADPNRVYTYEHVNAMRSMLARHLHTPHRLRCFTDRPLDRTEVVFDDFTQTARVHELHPDIVLHPLPPDPPVYKHCRRLRIFDPAMGYYLGALDGKARILQLDLDLVILDDVTPIFIAPGSFLYSGGNIAAMLFDVGEPRGLWDWYSAYPEAALAEARASTRSSTLSDQAIVNHYMRSRKYPWTPLPPGIVRFPYKAGAIAWTPPPETRAVHMYGKTTNPSRPEVQAANPWIVEHWR